MEIIANEVYKPSYKPKQFRKVMTYRINDIWSADIVDMQALEKFNDGYKYILTVIDIFSRFSWAIPQKTKTAKETVKSFEIIIGQTKALPYALWVDQGKEFLNLLCFVCRATLQDFQSFNNAGDFYILMNNISSIAPSYPI